MKLTILGKYSPFAPAGGACSGYWVEPDDGGPGMMLDCGSGALAKFQEYVGKLNLIETVVLSHLHFDHISDALILRYAADKRNPELPEKGVRFYAPIEPATEFGFLTYKQAAIAHAVAPGITIEVGNMKVTFYEGDHQIPTHAVRVESPEGIFAYSGDSRPCDGLLEAAHGADLFLCEASALEAHATEAAKGHLTARQAGLIAAGAGAKRLVLTHVFPQYDQTQLLTEARECFPGAVMADEGATYYV